MQSLGLYLHIPFCTHRCGYCDFNTYAGIQDLIPAYTRALANEVRFAAQAAGERLPVHSIYFGGGTPSLVPADLLALVFEAIRAGFEVLPEAEITLEANPGTLSLAYLQGLLALGVNRLSMGMQSAHPEELRILEREHGYLETLESVRLARQAGFRDISLDLIYGLPDQRLAAWQHSLELALALKPQHLSLYSLTVEHGTPLEKQVGRGLLPEPDPDTASDMYEWSMETLAEHGYLHYEISNWAITDDQGRLLESRHNRQYWLNQSYYGFGAGAHGFVDGVRTVNVLAPAAYIQRLHRGQVVTFPCTPATVNTRRINQTTEMQETMVMGLRLLQRGVSRQRFHQRFARELDEVFGSEIDELIGLKLLTWGGENKNTLLLTQKGRLLGNQVFMRFV